jgi:hypothetical protein
MDLQSNPCAGQDNYPAVPQFRWSIGLPTTPVVDKTQYAHVAHIVTYDQNGGSVKDTIYRVSGGDRANCIATIIPDTLVLTDPDGGNTVDWTPAGQAGPPPTGSDVNVKRIFANLVVAANGELLLIGGANDCYPLGAVKSVERFRPEILFGSGTPQVWDLLAEMSEDRREHQVALLLPDGS